MADKECLDETEKTFAWRAHPHRPEVNQRLGPQVRDLEDALGLPQPGHDPGAEGGERVDRDADRRVRRWPARLNDEEGNEIGEHVDLAAPRIAVVGERSQPHELDAVEPLATIELAAPESIVATGRVIERRGEDRDLVALPDELPGEIEMSRDPWLIGAVP